MFEASYTSIKDDIMKDNRTDDLPSSIQRS